MPETIETADGRTIPITDDPDAMRGYATGLTVSLSQKVNLGDYENVEPYAALRADLSPAVALDARGAITRLREQAERMKRVVAWQVGNEVTRYREDINGGKR